LIPDRAQDNEQWIELSQALIETGRQALAAAESRDPAAVFDAGGEIYLVCSECHTAFAPDALRSNFGTEN
jgi:mono/diheme cytochrome c family protein